MTAPGMSHIPDVITHNQGLSPAMPQKSGVDFDEKFRHSFFEAVNQLDGLVATDELNHSAIQDELRVIRELKDDLHTIVDKLTVLHPPATDEGVRFSNVDTSGHIAPTNSIELREVNTSHVNQDRETSMNVRVRKVSDYNDTKNELSELIITESRVTVSALVLLKCFAQNTSMHGIPNSSKASEAARKVFWAILFLASVGLFTFHLYTLISKFLEYQTTTNFEVVIRRRSAFPAVTICNLNAVRFSKGREVAQLRRVLQSTQDILDPAMEDDVILSPQSATVSVRKQRSAENRSGTTLPYSPFTTARPDSDSDSDSWFEGGMRGRPVDTGIHLAEKVRNMVAGLPLETRILIGYQIQDMLFQCTWNGRTCGQWDFIHFYNMEYGNCFTFNMGEHLGLYTTHVGPTWGLNLALYINQSDYSSVLSESAGIRVLVHDRNVQPFPEDAGFSVMPGTLTAIGIRKTSIERMGGKYGRCKTFLGEDNVIRNAYADDKSFVSYSRSACEKTCLQVHTMWDCNCTHAEFPRSGRAISTRITDPPLAMCNHTTGSKDDDCIFWLYQKLDNGTLDCNELCPIDCRETIYEHIASIAAWPSLAREESVSVELMKKRLISDLDKGQSFISNNLVRLQVYFIDLNTQLIREVPTLTVVGLLSDMGGTMGMWLGLSIISLFEVLELLTDLILFCLALPFMRRSRKNNAHSHYSSEENSSKNFTAA